MEQVETKEAIQAIQYRCRSCGGMLIAAADRPLRACPYCGEAALEAQRNGLRIQPLPEAPVTEQEKRSTELEKARAAAAVRAAGKDSDGKKKPNSSLILIIVAAALFILYIAGGFGTSRGAAAGRIVFPYTSAACVGMDVEELVQELEEIGFTNIVSTGLKDLQDSSRAENGRILRIMLDGEADFYSGARNPDTPIVIFYHSPAA